MMVVKGYETLADEKTVVSVGQGHTPPSSCTS